MKNQSKNNKWKIGFWIYFVISFLSIFYLLSKNNLQEVDLAFAKMDKKLLEKDLKILSDIVITRNLVLGIEKSENTTLNQPQKTTIDTIELEKIILVFKNERLFKIELKEEN